MSKEIEIKFLNINKGDLIIKLNELGAKDCGESLLKEYLFSDVEKNKSKFVRLRSDGNKSSITFKYFPDEFNNKKEIEDVVEFETEISDFDSMYNILINTGLSIKRKQEKLRHSFVMPDGTKVDIDTWPKVTPFVEIDGESKEAVINTALSLGFDINKAFYGNALQAIKELGYDPTVSIEYLFD